MAGKSKELYGSGREQQELSVVPPIDFFGHRAQIIPILQNTTPVLSSMAKGQEQERLAFISQEKTYSAIDRFYGKQHKDSYEAVSMLFDKILDIVLPGEDYRSQISYDSVDELRPNQHRQRLENFMAAKVGRISSFAYKPDYTAVGLMSSASVLEGFGNFLDQTPRQISAAMLAADARLKGDKDQYESALTAYTDELKRKPNFDLSVETKMLRTNARDFISSKFPLYIRIASVPDQLLYAAHEVEWLFHNTSDTYHPKIDNSLLIGNSVLNGSAGAVLTDSIVATGEEQPFAGTVDTHLIRTHVLHVVGDEVRHTYYPEYHEGHGTKNGLSLIDWHGKPDYAPLAA